MLHEIVLVRLEWRVPMRPTRPNPMRSHNDCLLLSNRLLRRTEASSDLIVAFEVLRGPEKWSDPRGRASSQAAKGVLKLVRVRPFVSNELGSFVVKRDGDVEIRTMTVRGVIGWGTIVELVVQRVVGGNTNSVL